MKGKPSSTRCRICMVPRSGSSWRAQIGGKAIVPAVWDPTLSTTAPDHRVLTLSLIKADASGRRHMDDDEAFDVAAFINSRPRPEMPGLERDYPNRAAKPVDNPYGPFADDFPLEQHRFGPFQPIDAYYKARK